MEKFKQSWSNTSSGIKILVKSLCVLCVLLGVYAGSVQSELFTERAQLASTQTQLSDLQRKWKVQASEIATTEAYQTQIADLKQQVKQFQSDLTQKDAAISEKQAIIDQLKKQSVPAPAATPSTASVSGSSSSSRASSASAPKSQTVYVTNTGSKYHRAGCQYLRKSKIPISLSDAKAQGYSACSRCY